MSALKQENAQLKVCRKNAHYHRERVRSSLSSAVGPERVTTGVCCGAADVQRAVPAVARVRDAAEFAAQVEARAARDHLFGVTGE